MPLAISALYPKKAMIYGYIRVSSDKQTVENQRFEINNFCKKENLHIDGWIEETISGTKNYNKRQLGKLLNRVKQVFIIFNLNLRGKVSYKVAKRPIHP